METGYFNPDAREIAKEDITAAHKIVSNKVYEKSVTVPKKRYIEDTIETVYSVPDTRYVEETIEEPIVLRERVIQVADPVVKERLVEVAEISYVEKPNKLVKKIIEEHVIEKPVIEQREVIREIPKIVYDYVEEDVTFYEVREVVHEVIEEVEEIEEIVIPQEVIVPRVVEVPTPVYEKVEVIIEEDMPVPVPVEQTMRREYEVPQVRTTTKEIPYEVRIPKFISVVVPEEFITDLQKKDAQELNAALQDLISNPITELKKIDTVATELNNRRFHFMTNPSAIVEAISNKIQMS